MKHLLPLVYGITANLLAAWALGANGVEGFICGLLGLVYGRIEAAD